jgi:hypothetical protein
MGNRSYLDDQVKAHDPVQAGVKRFSGYYLFTHELIFLVEFTDDFWYLGVVSGAKRTSIKTSNNVCCWQEISLWWKVLTDTWVVAHVICLLVPCMYSSCIPPMLHHQYTQLFIPIQHLSLTT